MTDDSELKETSPKPGLIETAAAIFNFAAVAAFVTTAFGFPAVMYRLQSVHIPLAFLSSADALTAGLIPTVFLGLLYLGYLAILRIMQVDTPGRTVSTVITMIGALLGIFALMIPVVVLWIIAMLLIGAATPFLHLFHLSYLAHRHAIPQSDVEGALRQLSVWPFAILLVMYFAARLAARYGVGRGWLESVRKWFSQERMTRHFSVCALLAVIVGLAVTVLTAVALLVIATVAIREFQMVTLSTITSLLLSLTFGVIAFCTVLVFGPGSREGLRNLKPVGVAAYLLIVFWYSVRFYPDIPQWLGGGRPAATILWIKSEDAPASLTLDKNGWSATEDGHGLVRIEANMLYATAETVVIVGNQAPPAGLVISRHSITALKGG